MISSELQFSVIFEIDIHLNGLHPNEKVSACNYESKFVIKIGSVGLN